MALACCQVRPQEADEITVRGAGADDLYSYKDGTHTVKFGDGKEVSMSNEGKGGFSWDHVEMAWQQNGIQLNDVTMTLTISSQDDPVSFPFHGKVPFTTKISGPPIELVFERKDTGDPFRFPSKELGFDDDATIKEKTFTHGEGYDEAPQTGTVIIGFITKTEFKIEVKAKGEEEAQTTGTVTVHIKPYWATPSGDCLSPDEPAGGDPPHGHDPRKMEVLVMHDEDPNHPRALDLDPNPPTPIIMPGHTETEGETFHHEVGVQLVAGSTVAGAAAGAYVATTAVAAAAALEAGKDAAIAGAVIFGPVGAVVGGAVGFLAAAAFVHIFHWW